MGTDKRERQKSARQLKIEAEQRAAKRAQRKRTALRGAIAAVVVLGGAFLYSTVWGDDGDDTATDSGSTTTTELTTTTTAPPSYTNPELAEAVLTREAPDPAPPPADTPVDALEISTLIPGEGEGAAAGDSIVVHYIGKLPDGTVFDESWARGEPFGLDPSFPLVLGQGSVITGWDEGLIGATIGERRRLVIGSDKAYGAEGSPDGTIAPNTPLVFEVDIVDIVKAG